MDLKGVTLDYTGNSFGVPVKCDSIQNVAQKDIFRVGQWAQTGPKF